MSRQSGFSLLELVVALTIIGILASVAVPSYREYVREARRDNALAELGKLAVRQETFRLGNRAYTQTVGAGGLGYGVTTEDGSYSLAVEAPSASCPIATCYVLAATPVGDQATDTCATLRYASTGMKSPAECWP